MKRTFLMLILLALLLPPIGFVGFLTYNQASFILPAKVNEIEAPPADLNPEYISLTTPDNITLHGVMLPAKVASPTLVLAFPGNTHNPVGFASYLKQSVFPEDNVAVASFSYRGYPNGITPPSSGKPSQKAMYADALTITTPSPSASNRATSKSSATASAPPSALILHSIVRSLPWR